MTGALDELGSPLLGGRPADPADGDSGGGVGNVADANPCRSSVRVANSIVSSATTRHSFLTTSMVVQRSAHREQDDEDERGGDVSDSGRVVKKNCGTKFCELQERFPIGFVLGGAVIGIVLGVCLSLWQPDDQSTKDAVMMWVGLIGDLFIRALKCIVMPLVFVSVTISVMDMLSLGEQGTIVGLTIGLYVLTTVLAAAIGSITSVMFSRFYELMNSAPVEVEPEVRIGCQTDSHGGITSYLTEQDDGSVLCMAGAQPLGNDTKFLMFDVNGYFTKANEGLPTLTFGESIYQVRVIFVPSI
jgi:hypothetical protein